MEAIKALKVQWKTRKSSKIIRVYLSLIAGNGQHSFEMASVFYGFQKQTNNLFVMHLNNHGIEKPPQFSQKDFSILKNKVHSPQN